MANTMQPLREEHKELFPRVMQIREAADGVGSAGPEALRRSVEEAEEFLFHHLIPHAKAEDAALYPEVERVLGAAGSAATMRRDHLEVVSLSEELAALRDRLSRGPAAADLQRDLRRVLYGLHAVVKLHFAKEEEVYLPLLEARLKAQEADALFAAMERAAGEAKRVATGH